MKLFAVAVLLIALAGVCHSKPTEADSLEPVKAGPQERQLESRDKRSLLFGAAYTAPLAYTASYTAPVAYSSAYSYPYAYSAYPYYASAYSPYYLA